MKTLLETDRLKIKARCKPSKYESRYSCNFVLLQLKVVRGFRVQIASSKIRTNSFEPSPYLCSNDLYLSLGNQVCIGKTQDLHHNRYHQRHYNPRVDGNQCLSIWAPN